VFPKTPCQEALKNARKKGAKSQAHPTTSRLFFLGFLFLVRFRAFLGKGSSKAP
jgi:hypothetical protein